MASQWLPSDIDTLGRLALLWDAFYHDPKVSLLAEIRLQEQRFGLAPLDRVRLEWTVQPADSAEPERPTYSPRQDGDPRLKLV